MTWWWWINPQMIGWWKPWFAMVCPHESPTKKKRNLWNLLISHFFGDVLLFFYPFSAPLWKVTIYPATFQSIPGWNQQLLGSFSNASLRSATEKPGSFDAARPWWLMFPARLSWYFWDFHGCIPKGSKGIMSGSIQISHTKRILSPRECV